MNSNIEKKRKHWAKRKKQYKQYRQGSFFITNTKFTEGGRERGRGEVTPTNKKYWWLRCVDWFWKHQQKKKVPKFMFGVYGFFFQEKVIGRTGKQWTLFLHSKPEKRKKLSLSLWSTNSSTATNSHNILVWSQTSKKKIRKAASPKSGQQTEINKIKK